MFIALSVAPSRTAVPPTVIAMSSTSPSLPPAGWYPDPTDPVRHRYWTGHTWGADTRGAVDPPDADTRLLLPLDQPVFLHPAEHSAPAMSAPVRTRAKVGFIGAIAGFLRK
jgi:hypothetical protein